MGDGWNFLDRKIDDYDQEWLNWKEIMINNFICFVIHLLAAETYRKFFHTKVS